MKISEFLNKKTLTVYVSPTGSGDTSGRDTSNRMPYVTAVDLYINKITDSDIVLSFQGNDPLTNTSIFYQLNTSGPVQISINNRSNIIFKGETAFDPVNGLRVPHIGDFINIKDSRVIFEDINFAYFDISSPVGSLEADNSTVRLDSVRFTRHASQPAIDLSALNSSNIENFSVFNATGSSIYTKTVKFEYNNTSYFVGTPTITETTALTKISNCIMYNDGVTIDLPEIFRTFVDVFEMRSSLVLNVGNFLVNNAFVLFKCLGGVNISDDDAFIALSDTVNGYIHTLVKTIGTNTIRLSLSGTINCNNPFVLRNGSNVVVSLAGGKLRDDHGLTSNIPSVSSNKWMAVQGKSSLIFYTVSGDFEFRYSKSLYGEVKDGSYLGIFPLVGKITMTIGGDNPANVYNGILVLNVSTLVAVTLSPTAGFFMDPSYDLTGTAVQLISLGQGSAAVLTNFSGDINAMQIGHPTTLDTSLSDILASYGSSIRLEVARCNYMHLVGSSYGRIVTSQKRINTTTPYTTTSLNSFFY